MDKNAKQILGIQPGQTVYLPDGKPLKIIQILKREFIAASKQLKFKFSYDELNLKFFLTKTAVSNQPGSAIADVAKRNDRAPKQSAKTVSVKESDKNAVKPSPSQPAQHKPFPHAPTLEAADDPSAKRITEGSVSSIVIGRTILYHPNLGAGQVSGFSTNHKYIYVRFSLDIGERTFLYPYSIEKILFKKPPQGLLERDKRNSDPWYAVENEKERAHFNQLVAYAEGRTKEEQDRENLARFGYYDKTDSFDKSVLERERDAGRAHENWCRIKREPIIGRFDCRQDGTPSSFYIGKLGFENKVVDWRDQRCAPFYQFDLFNGQNGLQISLVRKFESTASVYLGFVDLLNQQKKLKEKSDSYLADDYLVQIIEYNRSNKTVHDIIQSIQKNQYNMITAQFKNDLVVNGCAGSGKTMILFHRLSFMLFNDRHLDPATIFVVSPTELLCSFSDELSSELGINRINRKTVRSFNTFLLETYSRTNWFPLEFSHDIFADSQKLTISQIAELYSSEFQSRFRSEVRMTLTQHSQAWYGFTGEEMRMLMREMWSFLYESAIASNFQRARDMLEPQIESLKTLEALVEVLPRENVRAKSQNIKERLKDVNNRDTTLAGKAAVLDYLEREWSLGASTVYSGKDRAVSLDDQLFNPVYAYFDAMGKDYKESKGFGEFRHQVPHCRDAFEYYNKLRNLADRLDRFERFRNGDQIAYGAQVVLRLAEDVRGCVVANETGHFDFERYLWLVGFHEVFGSLQDLAAFVFIDEYQDLALPEIALYRQVMPRTCFNLFGDPEQTLHAKGVMHAPDLHAEFPDMQLFSINENYRNPIEITQFINRELKTSMLPIGLRGSISSQPLAKHQVMPSEEAESRTAMIVKDEAAWQTYLSMNPPVKKDSINLIFDDSKKILPNAVNVIPVNLVKGLEFDRVYVLGREFSKQEKYVAYTRAMQELIVLI